MESKELKIQLTQWYEIDRQKSTFEKIIFKKIPENPKTWEEYCKLTKGIHSNYANATTNMVYKDRYTGSYNEFATKERADQFIALGKILQLRDYRVKGYSEFRYALFGDKDGISLCDCSGFSALSLTFPTKEMAKEFKDCFEDLIKQASPLV